MSKKYSSASDSLKPGQLDRLTAKIKDCNPQKKELFTVKDFIRAAHKLCEGCEYYNHGCELLTSDCPKPFTPEMKRELLGGEQGKHE